MHDRDGSSHPGSTYMPMVIEYDGGRERGYDLFSRLLKDNIIFLGGPISSMTADIIVGQLLFLDSRNPDQDIMMYINSPGGEVVAGLAIVDTMHLVRPKVHVTVVGLAASMGAVIAASGERGHRYALPNAQILIHQPMGGVKGQASDIEIQARHIVELKERLNRILADRTGQSYERICQDTDRDYIMGSAEAVEYGIIDQVIGSRT